MDGSRIATGELPLANYRWQINAGGLSAANVSILESIGFLVGCEFTRWRVQFTHCWLGRTVPACNKVTVAIGRERFHATSPTRQHSSMARRVSSGAIDPSILIRYDK